MVYSNVWLRGLCPAHVGGDREFDGHGPDVTITAKLVISPDRLHLNAEVYFDAVETQPDWTRGQKYFVVPVAQAPDGYRFVDILSSQVSNAAYRDSNHAIDYPPPSGGLVAQFQVMGDTRGNDVGNCTGDDVFLTVGFNPITARVTDIARPVPGIPAPLTQGQAPMQGTLPGVDLANPGSIIGRDDIINRDD